MLQCEPLVIRNLNNNAINVLFLSLMCLMPSLFWMSCILLPLGPRSSVCGCFSWSSSKHFFFTPLPYSYVSGNATKTKTPANKLENTLFAVREEQLSDLIPMYTFIWGKFFNFRSTANKYKIDRHLYISPVREYISIYFPWG